MTRYVSDAVRSQVKERANECCEYCLLPDSAAVKHHEIDHIHAEKHGGATTLLNLCLSCYYCNHNKGSDLCSIDPLTGELSRLFNPRLDQWHDHFNVRDASIVGLTPIGRVTVDLFQMNTLERIKEREILIRLNQYPASGNEAAN